MVSQLAGALDSMTSSPCRPSESDWCGETAVPRSWAMQTWIEMAKYGTGTSAVRTSSTKPRQNDIHVMACGPPAMEHEAFKWVARTGVKWLCQLCDESGTHLRAEPLNRMTSNTSLPHSPDGTQTAWVPACILSETTQADPQTQGSRPKKPLGPWNKLAHHRGYTGSFVNFSGSGDNPRLIEVSISQNGGDGESVLYGWEYTLSLAPNTRKSEFERRGTAGKKWGDPVPVSLVVEPYHQTHVRLPETAKVEPGSTGKPDTRTMGGSNRWYWMSMSEDRPSDMGTPVDYNPVPDQG